MSIATNCIGCGHKIVTTEGSGESDQDCPKCHSKLHISTWDEACLVRMMIYADALSERSKDLKAICCPSCGKRICRSKAGTVTDTTCPKCNQSLHYEVKDDQVLYILDVGDPTPA